MGSSWDSYGFPFMVSLTIHAMVVAAMLMGWPASEKREPVKKPTYVQAKLVQLEAQAKPAAPQRQIVDLTKKREEEKQQRQLEEQRKQAELKKQEEARRQQALKRKEEADRQARVAAEKKQAEEKAKKAREEAEKRAREEAEKRAREEAAKRAKVEEEKKKLEQIRIQQEAFEQALSEEQNALAETEYATAAQSYIGAIRQRIEMNWSRPPSARKGMQCELLIRLVPTGRVVSVDIASSSGNDQFDRSAVQAVTKSEQFPEIKEMRPEVFERYYRELRLVFNPQDLRQ